MQPRQLSQLSWDQFSETDLSRDPLFVRMMRQHQHLIQRDSVAMTPELSLGSDSRCYPGDSAHLEELCKVVRAS
ncbi:unnamed protein product [Menidia menidia]|uniref:(Atlantic silverside) hypothetical protein n=1 Tax=Menidia menidia TaxID=238744 RepID=A0A8S4BAD6_9TELE|nr:unnamed protein product [Menidia menidia]